VPKRAKKQIATKPTKVKKRRPQSVRKPSSKRKIDDVDVDSRPKRDDGRKRRANVCGDDAC
jgi:hypothetical protein